jgi:hypothetical protein
MSFNVTVNKRGTTSKLVDVTITVTGDDTDPNLLLLEKLSVSADYPSASVNELIAVASPEDIDEYPTTLSSTGYYRAPSATLMFPSDAYCTEMITALIADLTAAASASRIDWTATESVTYSATANISSPLPYSL